MFSRPSAVGTRPAYLDNLFRDPPTPSNHSSTSSISCSSTASNYDLRSAYLISHASTPIIEENGDDGFSLRSKKSFLPPRRFRFGRIFTSNRHTYPQCNDLEHTLSSPPSRLNMREDEGHPTARRPSLPKIQTSFSKPRGASAYAKKPLPAVPTARSQELSCHRCYYFTARNCHGWVMGGSDGDSCETCLRAGFFGAK